MTKFLIGSSGPLRRAIVMGLGLWAVAAAPLLRAECGDPVPAQGQIFYVIPDGELITHDMTLTGPECGQGPITLSHDKGFQVEALTSFSRKIAGQTLYVVVFRNIKGDNPASFTVFKGSYIRGKNQAKYWGDLYKLQLPIGTEWTDSLSASFLEGEGLGKLGGHVGGFWFAADVPAVPSPDPAPSFQSEHKTRDLGSIFN